MISESAADHVLSSMTTSVHTLSSSSICAAVYQRITQLLILSLLSNSKCICVSACLWFTRANMCRHLPLFVWIFVTLQKQTKKYTNAFGLDWITVLVSNIWRVIHHLTAKHIALHLRYTYNRKIAWYYTHHMPLEVNCSVRLNKAVYLSIRKGLLLKPFTSRLH